MSDHDDFLVPQDADLSIKCSGLEIIILSKQILVIFAGLSVLCCLYLLWMYFVRRTPILRRHPTELAVFKCIFDLIFFQQFLWTPSLKKQVFYSDDLEQPEYYCTSSEIAAFLAFLTQFSHLGGALCFLVISIDLRIAYTNPFASIRHNWPKYAAFVVAVSSVSALALIAMGPRVYGISSTGSVWIQNRRSAESVSYPKVVLYYWFLLFIYTYSMWANFQFFRFRERGLVRTVSNRINIMNRSRLFVVAYITYDLLVLALQFVSFVTDETSRYLYSFDAYGDALRGTYNLIVILYISWSDVTWENMSPFQLTKVASGADALVANVAMESLLLQPHLNTALRAEILFFATQGIIYAAREGAASEAKKSIDRSGSQSRSVAPNSSEIGSLVGSKGSSARQSAVSGAADDFGVIDSDSSRIIGRATMAALPSGVVSEAGAAAAPVERHTFTTDISSIQESKSGLADGYRRNKMRGVRPSHNKIFSFTARQSALQPVGDEDVYEYESRESSLRSSMPRDASSIILRLNQEQDVEVAKEMEAALQLAVRNLGADPAVLSRHVENQRKGSRNDSLQRVSSARHIGAADAVGAEISPVDARHSRGRPLSWSRGNFSFSGFSIRGGGQFDTHNPMSASRAADSLCSSDVEMSVRPTRTKSAASESTDTSVKWRETLDVEFGVTDAARSRVTSDNDSDYPTWQRISKASLNISRNITLISNDGSHGQNSSQNSSNSAVKTSSRSTVRAVLSALNKATNVLNPVQQQFRFKDFRPKLFRKIRAMSGIDHGAYARSFETTCKAKFSDGRSGAFMFYSKDQKYIVKTTTKEEMADLQSILVDYMAHLENNPNTLLVHYLGAHCLTMYGVELYFVVMLNIFPRSRLSERYDLKGSWENRHGYTTSRLQKGRRRKGKKYTPLYLDNDLQHRIALDRTTTLNISSQIAKDVDLLASLQRMDYSLLVGVKRTRFEVINSIDKGNLIVEDGSNCSDRTPDVPKVKLPEGEEQKLGSGPGPSPGPTANEDWLRHQSDDQQGMPARYVEGPGTYFIGIIDILQGWTWKKQLERWVKVYLRGMEQEGLSAIPPVPYAQRFWKRCVLDTFEGLSEEDQFALAASEGTKSDQSPTTL